MAADPDRHGGPDRTDRPGAKPASRPPLLGWLFGLGHFTIGNYWIATAFTYQANMPAWLGGIAVVALALYLAVYPALAALAAKQFGGASQAALVLAFAAAWIVSEWLRSWVFTGFAWNPLAMAVLGPFERPGLAALAPWLGTYALSGLVALLAGCLLLAARARKADWRGAALLVVPLALPLLPAGPDPAQGHLRFTLIQPDVRQEVLDDPSQWERQFATSAAAVAGAERRARRGSCSGRNRACPTICATAIRPISTSA